MEKKIWFLIAAIFLLVFSASALEPANLDDIVKNLQANQVKIKDMYAETTTKITSNMSMPGQENKGPQTMVQKAKMWTKGQNKSKIEMLSPMKQTTITNGDQMAIINPETGQKMVQDLKKMREKSGTDMSQQMNLEKAKEFFDLSVVKKDQSFVVTGVPKKEKKFLGKMEFYVDPERWVPTKIIMYDAKGKPMSQSVIEYEKVAGAWVPVKNTSNVTTPMGKMKVEMEFENIKVNQGINDKEFEIK